MRTITRSQTWGYFEYLFGLPYGYIAKSEAL